MVYSFSVGYFFKYRPFQIVVTQSAWNRGSPCHIFLYEVVYDVFLEFDGTGVLPVIYSFIK